MAGSDHAYHDDLEDSSVLSTRNIETFTRKVTTTASHLMAPLAPGASSNDPTSHSAYTGAMTEIHKSLARRPGLQRSVFSMARTTPTDMVRSKLSTSEIQHRALAYVPEEMLKHGIPEKDENTYSLFQGFQATTGFTEEGKKHRRKVSRGRKLLEDGTTESDWVLPNDPQAVQKLKKEKAGMMHEFEMLAIRKNMASSEIREIDSKIANLAGMRRLLLDRLASFEQEEAVLEHDIVDVEERLDEAQDLVAEAEQIAAMKPTQEEEALALDNDDAQGFMSQSIYEKIPSANSTPTKPKRPRTMKRKSMPILHEHFEAGTSIREIKAHQDSILALDFDAPFGTLVTSAMDDSVRVWDLNAGRCMGLLEGHTASVRALQVEDNILATGSVDATIRLWDLSKAQYDPHGGKDDEDHFAFENPDDVLEPPEGAMDACAMTVLRSHVDEITALHFKGDVLVSGSADKTIRHWDLEKGRCVQTLDVMWAAAQAASTNLAGAATGGAPGATVAGGGDGAWRQTSRQPAANADFVGALQVFDAALACGTADGMVRLWDLRSGQVHRSLVGHTGPVTCLQFDDVHLVTGSLDRSIRIWDLRTGSIFDAYAYDNPVTSTMFDSRRIVTAAGEDVVKVYDKLESRQWDCGAGVVVAEEGVGRTPAIVERVRIRDGYMVEGRRDGMVGVWTC